MKHLNIYCARSLTDYVFSKDMKTYFVVNPNLKKYINFFLTFTKASGLALNLQQICFAERNGVLVCLNEYPN